MLSSPHLVFTRSNTRRDKRIVNRTPRHEIRAIGLSSFIAVLGVEDLYKGQHILKRDVALDGVGWGEDIAAEAAFRDMLATARDEGREMKDEGRDRRYAIGDTKIASIAKREEDIFLQGSSKPLKLPAHSPARKLLQYVRDEAHRFAQHYHHILRSKKMIGKNH